MANPSQLCQRLDDGTWWEPSIPDNYTRMQALRDITNGNPSWYFRSGHIEKRKVAFFFTKYVWVPGTTIWEPKSGEFLVAKWKDAVKYEYGD